MIAQMIKDRFGISTHALREEGDLELLIPFDRVLEFLPTPSARRATIIRTKTKKIIQ